MKGVGAARMGFACFLLGGDKRNGLRVRRAGKRIGYSRAEGYFKDRIEHQLNR